MTDLTLFDEDEGCEGSWNQDTMIQITLSLLYEALKEWNYLIRFFHLEKVRESFIGELDKERLWGGETGITRAERIDQLLFYFAPGGQMDDHLEHLGILRQDIPSGDEIRATIYEGKIYNLKKIKPSDEEGDN